MTLDLENIRTKIFEIPSVAEKKRDRPNRIMLSGADITDEGISRRITAGDETELFFIPPDYDMIPEEIQTKFARKRLNHEHRKFWRYANIVPISGENPRESFRQQMKYVHPDSCIRAYSWKLPDTQRVYVPLTALIDGRRLYFIVTKMFPEIGIRDRIDVDAYGSEAVCKLPSRSLEEVRRYTIGFKHLATRSSGEHWQKIQIGHACEDKEYKIGTQGQFADDHIVAGYTAVEISKSQTDDPVVNSPFFIPGIQLATYDRRLVKQVIKLYVPYGSNRHEERSLSEAERELLLWRFIGMINRETDGRSYERLFVGSYGGVEKYLVPSIQV